MPIIGKTVSSGTPPLVYVIIRDLYYFYCTDIRHHWQVRWRGWLSFSGRQVFRRIRDGVSHGAFDQSGSRRPYAAADAFRYSIDKYDPSAGGAFGIAVMNTYVTNRYAAHRK